jgi:hypothetical protein
MMSWQPIAVRNAARTGVWRYVGKSQSYGCAFAAYTMFFLLLASPYWLTGDVVAPHRYAKEIGANETTLYSLPENRKFADYSSAYIPEVTALHQGARSGWLPLWSNSNEFGRPLFHLSGFSPAYPPTWLIGRMVDSPHVIMTILSLGWCYLAGLFILMFCREERLAPLAALIAACSMATAPLFMYWLTFPMFPAVWCWMAALLWGITRLSRKIDGLGCGLVALSANSLLLTAYPQPVVYNAYILGSYSVVLAAQVYLRKNLDAALKFAIAAVGAAIVGILAAAPVYLDLLHTTLQSARVAPDEKFFTSILPVVDTLKSLSWFIALGTVPEIFGSPASSAFDLPYDGLSVPLLMVALSIVGLIMRPRKCSGWFIAAIAFLALVLFPNLYGFAVRNLGFGLSPSVPHGTLLLPVTIMAAYGADALLRSHLSDRITMAAASAASVTLIILVFGTTFGLAQGHNIAWPAVAAEATIIGLLAVQAIKPMPSAMVAALMLTVGTVCFPLLLRQSPRDIASTSPVVEMMRAELLDGGRYAMADPGVHILPPNLNGPLGLPSVHSYDSLSARRYHAHIAALGGEMLAYGRLNAQIKPDYGGAAFWMSDVALVLGATPIKHPNLIYIGEQKKAHLHRVRSRMGCCQIRSWRQKVEPHDEIDVGDLRGDPASVQTAAATISSDHGDQLAVRVTGGDSGAETSLLVLSRQYHRDWEAWSETPTGRVKAIPVAVNGMFQGVVLPRHTTTVNLQFIPYARYAWTSHVLWLAVLALVVGQAWFRRNGTGRTSANH